MAQDASTKNSTTQIQNISNGANNNDIKDIKNVGCGENSSNEVFQHSSEHLENLSDNDDDLSSLEQSSKSDDSCEDDKESQDDDLSIDERLVVSLIGFCCSILYTNFSEAYRKLQV